jgi:hypothetical protein
MRKKIGELPHEIDMQGRVWSPRGFEIKPHLHNGYHRVHLMYRGKRHTFRVNRLVALAFIINKRDRLVFGQVDHIDGNKLNNQVTNLRWVSAEENSKYRRERETVKEMIS